MTECNELADDMRTTPEQISNMKIFFSQSSVGQKEPTKRDKNPRGEYHDGWQSGRIARAALQRCSEALLTASDEKRLLAESPTNVLIDSFDDSDVVSPTTEAQIYNML